MAHLYNSASSYVVKPVRIQPIFISIIFHHYKLLTKIIQHVENLDEENSDNITDIVIPNKDNILTTKE